MLKLPMIDNRFFACYSISVNKNVLSESLLANSGITRFREHIRQQGVPGIQTVRASGKRGGYAVSGTNTKTAAGRRIPPIVRIRNTGKGYAEKG